MTSRIDWRELSRRAGPPFLAFVVLTWAAAWQLGSRRPEPDLYPFLKRSWPGADFEALPRGAFAVKRQGEIVGYATSGTEAGYSGPITLAVGMTPDGRIRSLAIIEYRDTPDLMKRAQTLLRSLLGKSHADRFALGEDVDAVSGATFSSRGLVHASLQAARAIAERGMPRSRASRPVEFGAPEIVLVGLLAAGAVGRNRPRLAPRARKALRIGTLLVSLLTLGFLFDRPWVIAFPIRLLSGDLPPWQTHLYWYLLFGALLLAFNRTGRNPYCPWICPFGAAQDVIGLVGGARRRRMPSGLLFVWVKRVLLWLAVLLGLLYRSPGPASYEVFAAFFRLSGTGFQIAILVFSVVVGIFVARPFCHWVCPVDTTEQFARFVRLRALRLLGRAPDRPHARRPVLLAMVPAAARPRDPLIRFRNGVLTAVGLLCALLVVGHLHERFSIQSRGAQLNLMGETFVSLEPAR
jgi:NosR/NirI family nitrous oxide reductase transcriptional regulator